MPTAQDGSTYMEDLPEEILRVLLGFLPCKTLAIVAPHVCKRWAATCRQLVVDKFSLNGWGASPYTVLRPLLSYCPLYKRQPPPLYAPAWRLFCVPDKGKIKHEWRAQRRHLQSGAVVF